MKRLPPTKIHELTTLLRESNLYHERNIPLIRKAVEIQVLIEKVEKEMSQSNVLLVTTGSAGQTKLQLHPLAPYLAKLHSDHARVLAYLGLGNKPSDADLASPEDSELLNDLINQ